MISVIVIHLFSLSVCGENLNLLRRWVVFPFDSEEGLKTSADNAWWKCRERITDKKKYLVASRQFLVQKDVFQPRRSLRPEDVKLLAHLLDADIIVTGFSEHRQFTLNVYLAQNGQLFWTKHMNFHPSLRAADQLELISDKLTQEFMNAIPYQAFTLLDPLIGKPVYTESEKKYAAIDTGLTEDVAVGTDVQWVQIQLPENSPGDPSLSTSKIEIVGEGRIVKYKRGVGTVEILRAKSMELISERALVRIPSIADKIAQSYVATTDPNERLAPEILPTIINPVSPESTSAKKNTMIFGSILSVLGILALAF